MTTATTVYLADLSNLIAHPVRRGPRPDALYLGLEDLPPGRVIHLGSGTAPEVRSNTAAFQPGDVMYGMHRVYLDKVVPAYDLGASSAVLFALRAKANVPPSFFAATIQSLSFLRYALSGTTSAQHPTTPWTHIRQFTVAALKVHKQQLNADLLLLITDVISHLKGSERSWKGRLICCSTGT